VGSAGSSRHSVASLPLRHVPRGAKVFLQADVAVLPEWHPRTCSWEDLNRRLKVCTCSLPSCDLLVTQTDPLAVQFSIGWWLWADAVAWKSHANDPISITFGHWVPGIVGTIGLFMCVSSSPLAFIATIIPSFYRFSGRLLQKSHIQACIAQIELTPLSTSFCLQGECRFLDRFARIWIWRRFDIDT